MQEALQMRWGPFWRLQKALRVALRKTFRDEMAHAAIEAPSIREQLAEDEKRLVGDEKSHLQELPETRRANTSKNTSK